MRTYFLVLLTSFFYMACNPPKDKEATKKEIFAAEKAFEKMAAEKGIPEAFYFFADDNAVIKRENDTLIIGKDEIKKYYDQNTPVGAKVLWTPDFIEVSECGTMAYTYGKYLWTLTNETGEKIELNGVFHTVWKKQADKSWKYVWD
ncbi:MAG TPA: DUF4440 domain-containing protein [Saprospiraceae bacterium]|nr:hypothetical protein [Saprospirales bacterium]HRQ29001.1 DUF4440 domain-containing protein [Saprospiraceae bacterium]